METQQIHYPSQEFSATAHVPSEEVLQNFRKTATNNPDAFWGELARAIHFDKKYDTVLSWDCPQARWFDGGQLNVSYNCLDRHLEHKGDKTALIWEGEPVNGAEPTEIRKLSYRELHALTCQIANTFKELGMEKGDRVALYMPMAPETVATMQACARLGLIHTVIFAGFSAQSIHDRSIDSQARMIVTADGTWRKGNFLNLKNVVDEALAISDKHTIEKVLVWKRDPSQECNWVEGRDVHWEDSVAKAEPDCPYVPLESEDPLFILYTSGTTGKPKGLFHTQAGYLLWAHWSTRWIFDMKDDDIYWCSADCGWITGHTYVAYGPLSNVATIVMYEGAPLYPDTDRFWSIIERHKVTTFYTAPTAIRTFMKFGEEVVNKHDMSSLRLLGTVGEPINPEAWNWFDKTIGKGKCPIVDTWWQTETGGVMISPLPGATPTKPGSATRTLPGISASVVDPETGEEVPTGEQGALIIDKPWPAMARGIWGNPKRFAETYWKTSDALNGKYFTGDFATQDLDGYFWISGRMDDVLNISGHRLGTAEVESALVAHDSVCEAAAVGIPDDIKGQSLAVFITVDEIAQKKLDSGEMKSDEFKKHIRGFVGEQIGAHAKPDQIRLAKALPKTRSGKIMRRLLRELASSGEITGDTTTLEDFNVANIESD